MRKASAVILVILVLLNAGMALAEGGGYLGFSLEFQEAPPEGRIVIARIYPHSPAASAGLQVGDELTEVDGVAFRSSDWSTIEERGGPFAGVRAGDPVGLTLSRAGRILDVDLIAIAAPPEIAAERRRQREKLLPQIGVKVLDRLSEESALLLVEKLPPNGDLRASAAGLTDEDAEALSHFLETSRLRVLFADLETGGSLQVRLGMRADTDEASIEIVRP